MARVTRAVPDAELDALEAIVARHPQGISRAALEREFAESRGYALAWRTVLRRFERLAEQGRVRTDGEAGRPYRPGPASVLTAPEPEAGYVPLSKEGAQVRGLVQRPMVDRKPVGYDAGLLRRVCKAG